MGHATSPWVDSEGFGARPTSPWVGSAPAQGLAIPPRYVDQVVWSEVPRGSRTLIADLDGDGTLDLAATKRGREVVAVASGSGNGTFESRAVVHGDRLEAAFGHVASANFDAQAGEELVYLSTRSDNDAPRLARATTVSHGGESGLRARVSDYSGYAGPFSVGDLNGDRHLDVLSAYAGSNVEPRERTYLQILYGNGDGTFRAADVSAAIDGIATSFVSLADLDGDAQLEAVLAGRAANGGGVLLVTDPLKPNDSALVPLPIAADAMLTVDLDRDTRVEIVVLDVARNSLHVLSRSPGNAAFASVAQLELTDPSYTLTGSVIAADLDDDGDLDLALAGNDIRSTGGYAFGPVAVIFHGGSDGDDRGHFQQVEVLQFLRSATEFAGEVIARDFDGDGRPELSVITYDALAKARIGVSPVVRHAHVH